MSERSRRSNPKQVFDVAKPNKSRPSNTTKPVIVTNRPILHDPMVNVEPSNAEPTTAPPLSIKSPTKIHLQPLASSAEEPATSQPVVIIKNLVDDSPAPSEPTVTSPIAEHLAQARLEAAETDEPDVSSPPDLAIEPDEPQLVVAADKPTPTPTPTTSEPVLKSGTAPIAEAPKDGALVTENDIDDQAAAAKAIDENIQKLVLEKRYFLPINTQEKRRTKRFIILGVVLILLLVVAWADIALDAGLIRLGGVKSLTHFFSN